MLEKKTGIRTFRYKDRSEQRLFGISICPRFISHQTSLLLISCSVKKKNKSTRSSGSYPAGYALREPVKQYIGLYRINYILPVEDINGLYIKGRSWPCILFIDKLAYVTFNVFTSLCYNGISQ